MYWSILSVRPSLFLRTLFVAPCMELPVVKEHTGTTKNLRQGLNADVKVKLENAKIGNCNEVQNMHCSCVWNDVGRGEEGSLGNKGGGRESVFPFLG